MDYNREDFVRLLGYKSNLIRDDKKTLVKKHNTKELYEQFLRNTLTVLEEEKAFFTIDDDFRDKILEVISAYRFEYRVKELCDMANEIISHLNELQMYSPEVENAVLDEYICLHENIRELIFTDLPDFANTIAQDIDVYCALLSHDLSGIDDITFIGATNYFLAAQPGIYQDKEILQVTEERAKKIKSTIGFQHRKTRLGATRTLSYLKDANKKNQE